PQWGAVNFELLEGWSNYHAMDFTFTKRFSHRWQGSATYTIARFMDSDPRRDQWYIGSDGLVARRPIGFPLARDMGGEYTLAGAPVHRVDMRLQKRLQFSERVQVFGIFEVFNLFNHANYGSYTTNENNANYGKPSFDDNLAYQPRMLQLGFRTTF